MGTHGIEVEFQGPSNNSNKIYRGTFLPNVAPEQGWDQIATLEALVKKSGYNGSFKSVQSRFTSIRRYQSIKFGMDYSQYDKIAKSRQ